MTAVSAKRPAPKVLSAHVPCPIPLTDIPDAALRRTDRTDIPGSADAPRTARRTVSGGGRHGHPRLIPYLALSAAIDPLVPIISAAPAHEHPDDELSSGLGNAAYAVGTVLAVQFAQHLPQRRMLVGYAVLLVVGSVLAASAQNAGMYIGGHVLQGLATSMLLIAAAPPLTIGFPRDKLRITAVIMNMCVFGAVALGPFIGGVQAEAHAWRPLFWIVAAIAVLALVLAALTFDDAPPADLDAPRDLQAIALATVGCTAAFVGAAQLTSHAFSDLAVIVPHVRRPGADRGADRLPVQGEATAADGAHDADERDPGRGRRRRAVRRGGLGRGDGADGQRAAADTTARSRSGCSICPRSAVPSSWRSCSASSSPAARDALPAAGRHGVARGWNPGVPLSHFRRTSHWPWSARR